MIATAMPLSTTSNTSPTNMPASSAIASPALRHNLAAAALNGRLGETVLLALLQLGVAGPGKSGLVTLGETIGGLRAVGLERDAQAIAVEAALAGGL